MEEIIGFRYEKDAANIVTVTMDLPGSSVNTMTNEFKYGLEAVMDRLERDSNLAGVILTSAKKTFFAGGNLNRLLEIERQDLEEFDGQMSQTIRNLRRLESLQKPVVAALNGAALGGGYEIALCCKRRIAVQDESARIGLPEAGLNLIPGAGGIVRLVRKIGFEQAMPLILGARALTPMAALEAGLVDEVVPDNDALLASARHWILTHQDNAQLWNNRVRREPLDDAESKARLADQMQAVLSDLFARHPDGIPLAKTSIVEVGVKSLTLDLQSALLFERKKFLDVLVSQEAKTSIRSFLDRQKTKSSGV